MFSYEYKVVPAPKKGLKGRGIKGTEAQFANALASLMNEYGADGWEYQRTDTLPCEERTGLRGKHTSFQNVLVFRRQISDDSDEIAGETQTEAPELAVSVATESIAKTHAPLLGEAHSDNVGVAPKLGAATEAIKVKDPRNDVTAQ